MGKIFTKLRSMPKHVLALSAMLVAAVAVPAVLFAWGPNRDTFTIAQPADRVVFNSITNNPNVGDERNFVAIKDAANTSAGGWSTTTKVEEGKSYLVRVYVHNNAASNLNLVAQNVKASASVPATMGKSSEITGFISSSNAQPQQVWAGATATSDKNFKLQYMSDSATFYNNHFTNGAKLGDSFFTQAGATLGYDKLDGKIPGCFQYAGYVVFLVKPVFETTTPTPAPNFEMSKQVQKVGETSWSETKAVNPGDTVGFLISYKNTGNTTQNGVVVKDQLPAGLTYVPGSTKLTNANGTSVVVADGVTTNGISIGNYAPGSNAFVTFRAQVAANSALPNNGVNTLVNTASVVTSDGTKSDIATVTVEKTVTTPPAVPSYVCDTVAVSKISRTEFSFSSGYTIKNATYASTTYTVKDASGKIVFTTTSKDAVKYTQTTAGTYTVGATVNVIIDGKTASTTNSCVATFTVVAVEKPAPVYTCTNVAIINNNNSYTFTMSYTTANVSVKSVTFVIIDANGKQTVVENGKSLDLSAGTYTVKATVIVIVDGKETVMPGNCEKQFVVPATPVTPITPVTPVTPTIEKCTVAGKENLSKGDAKCVTTVTTTPVTGPAPVVVRELPKTGTENAVVAMAGLGALVMGAAYFFTRRSL